MEYCLLFMTYHVVFLWCVLTRNHFSKISIRYGGVDSVNIFKNPLYMVTTFTTFTRLSGQISRSLHQFQFISCFTDINLPGAIPKFVSGMKHWPIPYKLCTMVQMLGVYSYGLTVNTGTGMVTLKNFSMKSCPASYLWLARSQPLKCITR